MSHDPIYDKFERWEGHVPAHFAADFLGQLMATRFTAGWDTPDRRVDRHERPGIPPIDNEDFFEYASCLRAADEARGVFVMMELGAGFGHWLLAGAKAAMQRGLPVKLVGVEAEPAHFKMMIDHFRYNGFDPEDHTLLEAAVTDHEGTVYFAVGDPEAWWGQSIMASEDRPHWLQEGADVAPVRAITLASLLAPFERVDLVDMDVQGEEYKVLYPARDELTHKVRRLHIGTHSREVENNIRELLTTRGWRNEYDLPCSSTSESPYGTIELQDGVQAWVNPKLS